MDRNDLLIIERWKKYELGNIWLCPDKRKENRYMFWMKTEKGWKFAGYSYSFLPNFVHNKRYLNKPHKFDIKIKDNK